MLTDSISMDELLRDSLAADCELDYRRLLVEADVIIAFDASSRREFTVFGTPSLESTASIKKPSAMRVLRVSLGGATEELDKLIALVRFVKERADFEGADE